MILYEDGEEKRTQMGFAMRSLELGNFELRS